MYGSVPGGLSSRPESSQPCPVQSLPPPLVNHWIQKSFGLDPQCQTIFCYKYEAEGDLQSGFFKVAHQVSGRGGSNEDDCRLPEVCSFPCPCSLQLPCNLLLSQGRDRLPGAWSWMALGRYSFPFCENFLQNYIGCYSSSFPCPFSSKNP